LAASTLASLQGGLVLSQAHRDPRALRRALDGALALIATYGATALEDSSSSGAPPDEERNQGSGTLPKE
jgi:hypothetical protein